MKLSQKTIFAAMLAFCMTCYLLACPESEAMAKVLGANTKEGSPHEQWEKLEAKGHKPDAAIGRALYEDNCLMCHGTAGKGDGELAPKLKSKPMDFTDQTAMEKEGDIHLFYDIAVGKEGTNMSSYYPNFSVKEIRHLVAYLRVLQKGQAVKRADYKPELQRAYQQAKVKRVKKP